MIDVIWPGVMEPHAVDLADVLKAENADFFKRIVENNTSGGMLIGVPWYTDAGILYYRTDLLQKYGFSNPPTTWDELETQAKKIIAGEKASDPTFTGFVWQGAAYEGLTCDGLEWQYSNGGGTIVDQDAKVTVDNDQAIAAFDRAKGWVNTISPQGVTAYQEEDARGVWQGGKSAFMRNWPYAYSLGQAKDSLILNKFDVTGLPKGSGEGASSAACLGGWQLMVSKYSKSQDAAKELVKYLASPELQKAYAIERSLLPTISTVYNDADVIAANPYYKKLLPIFQGGAVARPSTACKDLYPDVSTAYFTALNQIITGQAGDTKSAVKDLASKIQDILQDL
jgi:trehalose/maltose transport system substrate-binding protein